MSAPRMPDPERVKQHLTNLRRTRLEMEESRLQLEEITAKLEYDIRQQRLVRVRRSLEVYQENSPNFER